MKRSVLLVVALAGCFGTLDANLHPTVIPKLSALPDDKRAQQLDSANTRPDPEQRSRDLSPRSRKLELAAAITAAVIGDALSYTHTVTLGLGGGFEETGTLEKSHTTTSADPTRLVEDADSSALVPWIPVAPPSASSAADSEPAQ